MALVIADRCQETTTTTGTGTINLAGATAQYQTFVAGVGTGNTTYYCIQAGNGSDWETGVGTVTTGTPSTLSRTTIFASSNSGSAISLTGISTVFGNAPAALLGNAGMFGGVMNQPVPTSTNTGLTTWVHQDSASVADTPVGITITRANAATNDNFALRSKTAPSTPYTITALVSMTGMFTAGLSSMGIGWYDGTNKVQIMRIIENGNVAPVLIVSNYSTPTTYSANIAGGFNFMSIPSWLRMADDGTNITFSQSNDGHNFGTLYTVAKASGYLGSGGYTNVCFGVAANGAAAYGTVMSWRVT